MPPELDVLPADTELVPAVCDETPVAGEALMEPCACDGLGDVDGLTMADGLTVADGLTEARAFVGSAVALAPVPLVAQLVPVPGLAGALPPLAVALADTDAESGLAEVVAEVVAVTRPLALVLALAWPPGLPVALLLALAGLVSEADGGGDGVADGVIRVPGDRDDLDVAADEGDADDCGQEETGVGARLFAAVVFVPAVPPWPSA